MTRFQKMIALNKSAFEYCAKMRAHYECKICGVYLCTTCE